MSASKAEKARFWVAYFLEDLAESSTFKPGKLHLTFATWFVSDKPDKEIIDSFKKHDFGPRFNIKIGQKNLFGPKKDVPVSLVESSEALIKLHYKTLSWLESVEGRWAVKNAYVGGEFRAHIRRRAGTRLKAGQIIEISKLTLVTAARREDGLRKVAARRSLNEATLR